MSKFSHKENVSSANNNLCIYTHHIKLCRMNSIYGIYCICCGVRNRLGITCCEQSKNSNGIEKQRDLRESRLNPAKTQHKQQQQRKKKPWEIQNSPIVSMIPPIIFTPSYQLFLHCIQTIVWNVKYFLRLGNTPTHISNVSDIAPKLHKKLRGVDRKCIL